MMQWSSYAHLPKSKTEYYKILINLKKGMTLEDVNNIITEARDAKRAEYHYRTSLVRLGLFSVHQSTITLNYDIEKLKEDRGYLSEILYKCINENNDPVVKTVQQIVLQKHTYDIAIVVESIIREYSELNPVSLRRWIRPLIKAFGFALFLEKPIEEMKKTFEDIYVIVAKRRGELVALDALDNEIKKMEGTYNIVTILSELLQDKDFKFMTELVRMPEWASSDRAYRIGRDEYTHIRLNRKIAGE